MKRAAIVLVLMLIGLAGAPSRAVQPDEIMPDEAKEARARELSRELRCMVCQNQSIDDSDAPLARDLRLLVRERIAALDRRDGGKVKAAVDPVHRLGDERRVGNVADGELRGSRQVLALARRQIVEDADAVAACQKAVGEMRADKPAPARYQVGRHGSYLCLRIVKAK